MSILDKIDRVICLTLDKRYEMALQLKEQVKSTLGLNTELFVAGDGKSGLKYDRIDERELPPMDKNYSTTYPTWSARPNAYNAWKCHKAIFEKCKSNENLLLLEDDSELSEDFHSHVTNVEHFFANNPWDMIYFGCYHHMSIKTEDDSVIRMNGGGGFHGVLITPQIRSILLNWPPYGPYDWLMGRLHPYHNCYAIYPSIINQRSGFSFVEGCNLDKPPRDKLC